MRHLSWFFPAAASILIAVLLVEEGRARLFGE